MVSPSSDDGLVTTTAARGILGVSADCGGGEVMIS